MLQEPAKSAGEKCAFDMSRMNRDGTPNLWYGVSACVEDKHIHVRCQMDFISQLFILAESRRRCTPIYNDGELGPALPFPGSYT